MGRRRTDHHGRKYGKLSMLHYVRPGGLGRGAIWAARCDCGNTAEIEARHARMGRIRTCGNCRDGLINRTDYRVDTAGLPKGHRRHFSQLVRDMIRIDVRPEITLEDYRRELSRKCMGCGNRTVKPHWANPDGPGTPANLVPLCHSCHYYRGLRNVLELLEHATRITRHLETLYNSINK